MITSFTILLKYSRVFPESSIVSEKLPMVFIIISVDTSPDVITFSKLPYFLIRSSIDTPFSLAVFVNRSCKDSAETPASSIILDNLLHFEAKAFLMSTLVTKLVTPFAN